MQGLFDFSLFDLSGSRILENFLISESYHGLSSLRIATSLVGTDCRTRERKSVSNS